MTEPENKDHDPRSLAMPREFVLQNGLRIVTLSTPTLDTARMGVTVNSGSRDDPMGQEGTAHFLEHMLFQGSHVRPGTSQRAAQTDILQTFKDWGGGINANTNKMTTRFGFESRDQRILYENLPEAADILLDLIQHPSIKESDVDRERTLIKTEEATHGTHFSELTHSVLRASLYPGSRLEHVESGTSESLDRITAGSVREFWRKHYVPSNTVIFIQGKGTDEELLKLVTERLTTLAVNDEKAPDHPPLNIATEDSLFLPVNVKGVSYNFSWDVNRKGLPPLNERENIIVDAVKSILSNELFIKMRDKERLVYSCSSYRDITGAMVFHLASDQSPENITKSFTDFMQNFHKHLNQETLEKYKKSERVRYIKQFEDPTDVAFDKLWGLVDGHKVYHSDDTVKIMQGITLDEVQEMAARIFGKPFGMAVLGNPTLIGQVADNTEIAAAMNIKPNDKPVAGSFPMPDDIKPYDPRHGQTEPMPNPIQPRACAVR